MSNITDRSVSIWLGLCSIMIVLMVFIGGVTRLTNSGLSITEWKPIIGIIPPINENQWIVEKQKYNLTPEYKKLHYNISAQEFKKIYLIEYFHRLVARLTVLIFLVPFIYFLYKGKIKFFLQFVIILLLMLLQGVIGWYMVKSGLSDNPYISHYRLTLHLLMALLIFYLTFRQFLKCSLKKITNTVYINNRFSIFILHFIPLLIVVQMMFGGLIAGLHGGLIYNTFPLIEGKMIPKGLLYYDPLWYNFFHNVLTIQFVHRILPIMIIANIIFIIINIKNFYPIYWVLVCTVLQFFLGVLTLLFYVPLVLASLHQVFAFILFSITIYAVYYFKLSRKSKI